MLNETLCNEDNIKQAHMTQINFYMKKLLGFQRMTLDLYAKLQALRSEDESDDRSKFYKLKYNNGDEEDNFFLQDELENAAKGNGYEEINMNAEGELVEMELVDKEERNKIHNERGYFLQPIYCQTIEKKIYLYDDVVREMKMEFRQRLKNKRDIIARMKLKCKELALDNTTLICQKCSAEVSQLKTVIFQSPDYHQAKCVFGHLKRVEVEEALKDSDKFYKDSDNQDFIRLYLEIFEERKRQDDLKEETESKKKLTAHYKPLPRYAFSECRNHHLVGIIVDQLYYFTDISPIRIMFPQAHYEDWSDQFWEKGYLKAFELETKLNLKRAQESRTRYNKQKMAQQHKKPDPLSLNEQVICELCNAAFEDCDRFILHCNKDPTHIGLIKQFMDESYDLLFEQLDQREAEL